MRMPKHTQIYTRTGDDGTTGLVGGERIEKGALRIETYGTVDELSSAIGVARAALRPFFTFSARATRLDAWLAWVQDVLFNLGSELATPRQRRRDGMPQVGAGDVAALERAIDEADGDLAPLNAFVLPGGSLAAAHLHVARTVCRRAERRLVTLRQTDADASIEAAHYLNRLSDALFVWSRWINDDLGEAEYRWNSVTEPPSPGNVPRSTS